MVSLPDAEPDAEPSGPPSEPERPQHGELLANTLLGGPRRFTAEQVVAEQGMSLEVALRLWRALGFPDPGSTTAFTDSDSEAIRLAVGMVDEGLVDLDLAVNLARGVGQTMSRLADWQVSAITHHLESVAEGGGVEAQLGAATAMAAELSEPFERLLVYVWRRHVAAAATRMEAMRASTDDVHTTELSVGFADIVGFTALSNRLTQDKIGDLVELFEARCADVVASRSGRVIKSLGDSVLFVNDDPVAALDTAEGIINVIGRDPRMPDVRVGVASGSVVMRLGDVFGPPVNMAARLTQVARRNRVIIDAATAAKLPQDEFETRRLPARPVRGFGLVEPLTVRRP